MQMNASGTFTARAKRINIFAITFRSSVGGDKLNLTS